jgi:hypothetical protein
MWRRPNNRLQPTLFRYAPQRGRTRRSCLVARGPRMAAGIGFRAPALKLRCPRLASASRRHAVPADMDSVIARNGAFGASPPSSRPASKSRRAFSLTEGVGESARVGRRGGRFALSRLRGRIGERARQGRKGHPAPETLGRSDRRELESAIGVDGRKIGNLAGGPVTPGRVER